MNQDKLGIPESGGMKDKGIFLRKKFREKECTSLKGWDPLFKNEHGVNIVKM